MVRFVCQRLTSDFDARFECQAHPVLRRIARMAVLRALLVALLFPAMIICICDRGVEVKFAGDLALTREYLLKSENPVLIKGLAKNWPALKEWTIANLIKHHGNAA